MAFLNQIHKILISIEFTCSHEYEHASHVLQTQSGREGRLQVLVASFVGPQNPLVIQRLHEARLDQTQKLQSDPLSPEGVLLQGNAIAR